MLTIRPASADDHPYLVELWAREGGPTSLPCTTPEIERLVARDADALLVAEREGGLVGSLIVGWDGWRCHLYRLAVDRDARRAGIATALLDAARARAVQLGAVRFDATVHPDNAGGIAFWSAAGFERDVHGRWTRLL